MNKRISEYVGQYDTPRFFQASDQEILEDIHTEIKGEIESATATMTIEIDRDLMCRAEAFFARIGWTLEEACILFLYWFITCPEKIKPWLDALPDEGSTGGGNNTTDDVSGILRRRRSLLGMTQQQVADKAKITLRQYQKFECGERNLMSCSFLIACRVIEALSMDISEFYHEGYIGKADNPEK